MIDATLIPLPQDREWWQLAVAAMLAPEGPWPLALADLSGTLVLDGDAGPRSAQSN